ncbi:hypothetical protein ADUPG1_005652, partial [Aduncisulcus paluster]
MCVFEEVAQKLIDYGVTVEMLKEWFTELGFTNMDHLNILLGDSDSCSSQSHTVSSGTVNFPKPGATLCKQ